MISLVPGWTTRVRLLEEFRIIEQVHTYLEIDIIDISNDLSLRRVEGDTSSRQVPNDELLLVDYFFGHDGKLRGFQC